MRTRFLGLIISLATVLPVLANTSLTSIETSYQLGEIDLDTKILNEFYLLFDQDLMDSRFQSGEMEILRCGTPIIIEYEAVRPQLSPGTIAIIEDYLTPDVDGIRDIYVSPGGHYLLSYSTTGGNGVPSGDSDLNGVPDYVENAAAFMDHSWNVEIDEAGFAGPNLTGGDGYYNVSFESMGAYGYTTPGGVDGNELTRIVLHNTFLGFPPNDDPAGNQIGAMKVTCAHEFKHASQRVHSNWSEGGWVELDATWAEEFVYDYVNDCYNYLGNGSALSQPHWALNHDFSGGQYVGSYEDYLWQDFLHQRFGANAEVQAPLILDYWTWRETHQGQAVLTSYDQVLSQDGSSLADAFEEFVVWNFFTGSRAVTSGGETTFGYDEAGDPGHATASLYATHSSYPVSASASGFEHLACRMIQLTPGNQEGLEILFDGQNSAQMSAMWAVQYTDATVEWGSIDLDANNDGDIEIDTRNAVRAALIPVVTQTSGSNFSASYTINEINFTLCDAGDLNDDGSLDVSDLVRLVNVILGNGEPPNDVELCAGDVNGDEQTSVQDVVALVSIILQ